MRALRMPLAALLCLTACGGGDSPNPPDGGPHDAPSDGRADATPPPAPVSTAHCAYEPLPATAGAGGTVTAGAVQAGAAEGVLRAPVGSALGGFTARADFMGEVRPPDRRFVELAGAFKPSLGIETLPRVKALALTAGDETVVLLKADLIFADDAIRLAVEEGLGDGFSGKVLFTTSHSHSAWGHFQASTVLQIGAGRVRSRAHDALVEDLLAAARAALDARAPARLGFAHDPDFDPDDLVSRDRRRENDDLPDGSDRKDHDLFVLRVDDAAGEPLALVPIFGIHGTVLDADNPLASTDAMGAIERSLEESFDRQVLVMHLQGAAGDVSPAGTGGIACPGEDPCYDFARAEMVGRYARDAILAAWTEAGDALVDETEIEMVTRAIPLGPDWETFTVRGGALRYAPWDGVTAPDMEIFDADGEILSPIDEFNAPYGAGLCGEEGNAVFTLGQLPGTRNVPGPYQSCVSAPVVAEGLGPIILLPFEDAPYCTTTQTTVSALRIGDHVLAALPGEPLTLAADFVRDASPASAENTIVLGYAQDHMGYILTPEDWLRGGYEPSINIWGPLEGQYVLERAVELLALVTTPEREDAGGAPRNVAPTPDDSDLPPPDNAPMAGTVPDVPWERVYVRGGVAPTRGQPVATVPRLGVARFTWIGEDPMSGTPRITVEHDTTGAGDFAPLTRRSGRVVEDLDVLLTHTPDPLIRDGDADRTHWWSVEWQAVPTFGATDDDDLAEREGVALGRYRFRVEGTGYELVSDAFEVVAGEVQVADAARGATAVTGAARYHAPDGWRLLHPTLRSNEPIPLESTTVEVTLTLSGGGSETFPDVATDATGAFSVSPAATPAEVTSVTVTDRFGNTGTASL